MTKSEQERADLQKNLRGIRTLYNISCDEIAKEIGITRQQINNIENGKNDLSKANYIALSAALPELIKRHSEDRKNFEEMIINAQDYLYNLEIDDITDCDWVRKILKR